MKGEINEDDDDDDDDVFHARENDVCTHHTD